MCIGLLERGCILTMMFKKRSTREEIILDIGIIRVHLNFLRFDIILNAFITRETPANLSPRSMGVKRKTKGKKVGRKTNVEGEALVQSPLSAKHTNLI